jgi:hypothetical protein
MFKRGLLTSTAIIFVASISAAAAQPEATAASKVRSLATGRDANGQFLCNYGALSASNQWGGSSASLYSHWQHLAVPVTGHGQTVAGITVMEAQSAFTYSANFSAGIYSNTASGLPGRLLAGGKGKAGKQCAPVRISIPPLTLKRKTKYWVEETVPLPHWGDRNEVYWEARPHAKQEAYEQSHYYNTNSSTGSHHSGTSPWAKQTIKPYFKLR